MKRKNLFSIIALLLVFLLLLSGCNSISKTKQEQLEAALEEEIAEEFTPVFRFAIGSDVHISAGDSLNTERLQQMIETAYRYSDSHPTYQALDAFLLAGDNVDRGYDEEYDILTDVLNKGIRPETKLITIMGNHEFISTGHEGYVRHMGEELDKHEVVKGFHFIGISPDPKDTWQTPKQILWMDKELRKAEKDDPNKPIFTMQHGHIWNTVYVAHDWYTQMSLPLHMVYSKYPQVVNFSGHSHSPVNHPRGVWQNSYTQVACGTLFYFELQRDIGDSTIPEDARNAAQYMIVEVDAQNRVKIQPFNILTNDFMKTPATTDDPAKQLVYFIHDVKDKSSFVYTKARKKLATAPWFEAGDEITIDETGTQHVALSFPQAESDECVYGYRITLKDTQNAGKKIEKEIYSKFYLEPMPETLSAVVEGLSAGTTYQVTVTPLDAWLNAGAPLQTEVSTTVS